MASPRRRPNADLTSQLSNEAWRFDFFQAVRLLEHIARSQAQEQDGGRRLDNDKRIRQVGHSSFPHEEVVRFRSLPARSFPSGAVARIRIPEATDDNSLVSDALRVPEMQVAFMGLTGPQGVLPDHYLELLLARLRERDFAMRDFFDLFNHRTISFFYRAWAKYRQPVNFERARLDLKNTDPFTQTLESLVGIGTSGLKNRLKVDDEALLFFSGHFSHGPRSASALKNILRAVFKVPVEIAQFRGRWLTLNPDESTQFPTRSQPNGQFNQLGVDAMIGSRVWDVQGSFGIRLGPMNYATFAEMMPDASRIKRLISLARSFVGAGLEMEVQLILKADEVPGCKLGGDPDFAPRLGWNTWITSTTLEHDCEDASFFVDDLTWSHAATQ